MRGLFLSAAVLTCALSSGCGGPNAGVSAASYDPDRSARAAFDEFDADKDGFLSGAELEACPGIKAAAARIDANTDKKLSRDELTARFATYAGAAAASGVTARVTLGGSPVSGATVTFTPEPCLGNSILSAAGTTDEAGVVTPVRSDGVPGLSPGVYRVAVAGPGVPADYGSRPLLGYEVAADGRGGAAAEFKLVAKPK